MFDAAASALLHPPTCIDVFASTPMPGFENDIVARFALACKACNSSRLKLMCFPIVAQDSETYASVAAGEVVERNPHHVVCAECGKRALLFDASKHGYDGALGHGSNYEQGAGEERAFSCNAESYSIQVAFIYNIESSELQEIAADETVRPEDLFDWICISAVSQDGVEVGSVEYECA